MTTCLILGSSHHQEQQQYGYRMTDGSPVVHVDMDKPVELVFNVGEGSSGSMSFNQQQRRDYSSRMMNTNASALDSSSTMYTGKQPAGDHSLRHSCTCRNATAAANAADRVSCLGRSWRHEYLRGSILECWPGWIHVDTNDNDNNTKRYYRFPLPTTVSDEQQRRH